MALREKDDTGFEHSLEVGTVQEAHSGDANGRRPRASVLCAAAARADNAAGAVAVLTGASEHLRPHVLHLVECNREGRHLQKNDETAVTRKPSAAQGVPCTRLPRLRAARAWHAKRARVNVLP